MRCLAVCFVLILSACTGSTQTTDSETTMSPASSTSTSPTTATPVTATSIVPSSSTTTPVPPDDIPEPTASFAPLPMPDESLPFEIGQVAIGETGLLYAGSVSPTPRDHPNEGALWHYDGTAWTRTLVMDITTDEYWGTPKISNLTFWDGRYLVFLQGDMTAPESTASMLTSTDGQIWTLEHLAPPRTAAGSFGRLFATPESPPRPGSAGVAGVTTTSTEIIAVGWISTSEGSTAAVWRSTDGRAWTLSPLPNALWANEWANTVSVGDSGWLVAGTGPVHSNSLLWFSPDGQNWEYIADQFGEDEWWSFSEIASGADGLVVATFDMNTFEGSTIWQSDDGLEWTPIQEIQRDLRFHLASNGSTMTRIQEPGGVVVIEHSTDGLLWNELAVLPGDDRDAPDFRTWVQVDRFGESVAVTRFETSEEYQTAAVQLWMDAPTVGVVLVDADDTLNVREGVLAAIISELDPDASEIQTTGRTDGAAGSLWIELLHNGVPGWVNSFYLTEEYENLSSLDPLLAIEEFANGVFRSGEPLGPFVGPKGLTVTHFDEPMRFTVNDDPMSDPTIHIWTSPGCGSDPSCAWQTTFADQVAAPFLSAWDDEDRVVKFDSPLGGGNATLPDHVIPTYFRNFHYVTVFDPGDDPDYGGLDWITWYVFLDLVDGELTIAGLSVDMWAP